MTTKQFRVAPLTVFTAAVLAGCSAGSTTAPGLTVQPPGPSDKLQFAVGTANIYGGTPEAVSGLNVVSTFRQANGHSATGVNTPFITGQFVLPPIASPAVDGNAVGGSLADPYTTEWTPSGQFGGPSLPELGGAAPSITGTPQTIVAGTPACDAINPAPSGFTSCLTGIAPNASTFGQAGGVFAMGIAPYNITGPTQQSYSYAPYAQPFYDTSSTRQFVPWGGPPAFDPDGNGMGTRDGLIQAGNDSFGLPYFLGVGEGVTIFEGVTVNTGAYSLAVQVATIGGGGHVTVTTFNAGAQLNSPALLGNATAPLVTPDANGDGGATMIVPMPGGATESLVQVVDYGPGGGPLNGGGTAANCQGQRGPAFAPVYYTIHVTASGPTALGPLNGPNTATNGGVGNLVPSPSICTLAQNQAAGVTAAADNFTVQLFGFDYQAYEAAVSLLKPPVPPTPPITGGSGQSDITVSAPAEYDWNGSSYTITTLSGPRRPLGHRVHLHPHNAKPKVLQWSGRL